MLANDGSSYWVRTFRDSADSRGIKPKRTRLYRPQANGNAEAFVCILLRGWAHLKQYHDNAHRLAELPRFIHRYNRTRPHFGLNGRTSIERLCQRR